MTFDLEPTDLKINRDHLLIKDYLPTKFEASGAKPSFFFLSYQLHKVKGDRHTEQPTDGPTDRQTDRHVQRNTVNVVIFAGGKFRENIGKTFCVGVISRYYSYFLHKGIWVLFSRGGNFREEDKSAKNAKITPTRKFPRLQYAPPFSRGGGGHKYG